MPRNAAASSRLLRLTPKRWRRPWTYRELTHISEALDELGKLEPALAEIIDLKFFCGFSFAEIAAMRDVSERTVQRQWETARIYLHRRIRTDLSL